MLSARLGKSITESNIGIKIKQPRKGRRVSLQTATLPVEKIEVEIHKDAYHGHSGGYTAEGESSADEADHDAHLDEDIPVLMDQIFRNHVAEDCVSVQWVESSA